VQKDIRVFILFNGREKERERERLFSTIREWRTNKSSIEESMGFDESTTENIF
jgi:hypothetical protein